MNVVEINPQGGTAISKPSRQVALTLPLTVVAASAWVIIVFLGKYIFPKGASPCKQLGWIDVISRKHFGGKYQLHEQSIGAAEH